MSAIITSPTELYEWLMAHVEDGGNKALQEVAEFARVEDESLAQRPAAATLLCWGESGRAALARNAIRTPTVKNLISAFQFLSVGASGSKIVNGLYFLHHLPLIEKINATLDDRILQLASREYLAEVFQNVEADDLLIPLGTAFTGLALQGGLVPGELTRALSARWLKIGPTTIAAYEELLATRPAIEPAFQDFFSLHPQFLDPMAVQVWAQPDFHGAHEPDFLIRRADDTYCVVEIECPSKMLLTQAGQLSAEATHAEKQATDYRAFLNERVNEVRQHFPGYRGASCLVVVGMEKGLVKEQAVALSNVNSARHNVTIVGFDWLARRARTIVSNMSNGDIEIVKKFRVL